MTSVLKKTTVAACAVLCFAAFMPQEALAGGRGWHGGGHGGGWHGRGWHGGGWHGGGWRAARWHGPGRYWRRGGWAGPVAAGLVGGLALGALASSAYAYGPSYGPAYWGGGCTLQNQPVYDAWGRFRGYQTARVCY
jgi:hypothetical protein